MMSEGFDSQIENGSHKHDEQNLYQVIVFNNDFNTVDEVSKIIQRAVCCSIEVAEHITWVIHNEGKAIAMIAPYAMAKKAAGVICTIGIKVIVSKVKS